MPIIRAVTDTLLKYAASSIGGKIQGKVMDLLAYRKNQIFNNNIELSDKDWHKTEVSIQKHDAKRRGTHYDFRIMYKKRLISFVMNKLPSRDKQNIIRTVDHKVDYADFEGIIPDGEFGAGKVKLVYNGSAVARIRTDGNSRIKILIPSGKAKGVYSFVEYGDDKWMVRKVNLPKLLQLQRHKYILKSFDSLKNLDNMIAEEKIDGAYSTMVIGKNGSVITGRRLDKDNKIIDYTYKLPHLSVDTKSDKFAGTIINGEVFANDVRTTSRILNSNPENAVEIGKKANLYIFDIRKLVVNGKVVKIKDYNDIIKYRKEIVQLNDYFKEPKIVAGDQINNLYKEAQEGIVIKSLNLSDPWIKVIKRTAMDLRIKGFTEGTGKFKGRGIGAFIVEDRDGSHEANVGTGLDDTTRIDAYENPKKYIGKIVKVEAKEITDKSLRAPVFIDIRNDKDIADNI